MNADEPDPDLIARVESVLAFAKKALGARVGFVLIATRDNHASVAGNVDEHRALAIVRHAEVLIVEELAKGAAS